MARDAIHGSSVPVLEGQDRHIGARVASWVQRELRDKGLGAQGAGCGDESIAAIGVVAEHVP